MAGTASVEACQIHRLGRLQFLVRCVENALACPSHSSTTLVVSLVRGSLLILNVHCLRKFHLFIAVPLGYAPANSWRTSLLGFWSFYYRKEIFLVLRVQWRGIHWKQAFNQRWLMSVFEIIQAQLAFKVKTPRKHISIFGESVGVLRSAVNRLECYLHILRWIRDGYAWAVSSHEISESKDRCLRSRHLIILDLLKWLSGSHGMPLLVTYAQLSVSVGATCQYFKLICQK